MKIIFKSPLLVGIVVISIVISVVSGVLMGSTYEDYSDSVRSGEAPLLSMFFRGASDGVFPWSEVSRVSPGQAAENSDSVGTGDRSGEDGSITESDAGAEGEILSEVPSDESYMKASAFLKKQNVGIFQEPEEDVPLEEPGEEEASSEVGTSEETDDTQEEVVYEFTEVDDDYFNDALFIGDSRTVGLSEYCEELDTRATFYSRISLTIFDVLDKPFIKTEKGKISIEEALSEEQYGKIYIMLGLNEIGTGNTEYFKNAYADVLKRIRELEPDAIIYIQGIMHVTGKKSDSDKYFNNDYINERNAAIAELADQKDVFYIDMNEAVDDEDGNLAEGLSFDEVHLKASSYERWHEFLLHNAIVR